MAQAPYQPRVTAGMPLPLLLAKARRSGGAGLERRHLAALEGLALLLPHGSAAGKATPNQIGDAMSYSGRWMKVALAELEDLGLLEWRRGGVVAGVARPGWFRVCKRTLCSLIVAGVEAYRELLKRRSAEAHARIRGLRYCVPRRRHKPTVEVAEHLYPYGEVTAPAEEPEPSNFALSPPADARTWAERIRRERGWRTP